MNLTVRAAGHIACVTTSKANNYLIYTFPFTATPDDDDVIAVKEEKKPVTKPKSKILKCIVCAKVRYM